MKFRTSITEESQTSRNSQVMSVFKCETKFQKASQGKSALLFYVQKKGFHYRYCFDLLQHVLFILIQAIQKYKIKAKMFVINYCVLDFSKICINSSRPSFQLVGGYNKFSSRTTYSKYSRSSSSTSFIIILASSIRFSSSEYAESISESLILVPWFCPPDNSGKKNNSSGLPGIVSCPFLLI